MKFTCGNGQLHPFLKKYLGYCFYKTAAKIRAQVDQELEPFGIVAPQFGMLITLLSQGPMTQGELGAFMAVDKATMVHMIDGLEENRFLTRVTSKKDRRANLLEVTKAGQRAVKEMDAARKRAENNFLKPLNAVERRQLRAIVSKLITPE